MDEREAASPSLSCQGHGLGELRVEVDRAELGHPVHLLLELLVGTHHRGGDVDERLEPHPAVLRPERGGVERLARGDHAGQHVRGEDVGHVGDRAHRDHVVPHAGQRPGEPPAGAGGVVAGVGRGGLRGPQGLPGGGGVTGLELLGELLEVRGHGLERGARLEGLVAGVGDQYNDDDSGESEDPPESRGVVCHRLLSSEIRRQ